MTDPTPSVVHAFECVACGRRITNAPEHGNFAHWTYAFDARQDRYPYCADSKECERDAEVMAQGRR